MTKVLAFNSMPLSKVAQRKKVYNMKKLLALMFATTILLTGCGNSAKVAEEPPKSATTEKVAELPKPAEEETPAAPVIEDAEYYIKLAEEKLAEKPSSIESERAALEFAQQAVKLDPESALARYTEGRAKINLGRFRQAYYSFSKAIELNPDYEAAYLSRGFSGICMHNKNADLENAIEDFKRVIEFNPNSVKAYCNIGHCYSLLKEYDLALENFDKAIAVQADYAITYYDRGLCYKSMGEEEKAQADFAKARELGYHVPNT